MTDTTKPETTAVAHSAVPKSPFRAGGTVMAIIPQDVEQVWRLAGLAWQGGMAPKSLVDKKTPEEAQAACAIAIMAGAELGLTPMMALRSYAVVNGRPALWGDGLKAVVRQSGLCEYIKTGSDQAMGWCEAKRKDTGEIKRVEFTLEQAKRAGLTNKEGPWKAGYADMMMERRAANRCLNDLFADVLGGLASAEEAYEDGPMPDQPSRPSLPADLPDPGEEPEEEKGTVIEGEVTASTTVAATTEVAKDVVVDEKPGPAAADAFLTRLGEDLDAADDPEAVEQVFDDSNVQVTFAGVDEVIERAFGMRQARLDVLAATAQDQPRGGLFGDAE